MSKQEISSAVKECANIAEAWPQAMNKLASIEKLAKRSFDRDRSIPNAQSSLSEIGASLLNVSSLIQTLPEAEILPLVPVRWVAALSAQSLAIRSKIENLAQGLETIESEGNVSQFDSDDFILVSQNTGTHVDLKSILNGIENEISDVLSHYYSIQSIVGDSSHFDFSEHLAETSKGIAEVSELKAKVESALNNLRQEVDQFRADIEVKKTEVDAHKSEAEAHKAAAEAARKTIDSINSEAAQKRDSINGYESDVATKSAEVNNSHDAAVALNNKISQYTAKFDQFDNDLDDRNKSIQSGEARQKDLFENLNELHRQIQDVTKRSEDMLKGASTASLAASFAARRNELTAELKGARYAFYGGIGLLALLAIPLADFVLPIGYSYGTAQNDVGQFVAQVAARTILLLPAIWLTTFAAARHARLLRLREHYGYKSSVAESVEGFKKQAASHEEDIAAAAFFVLTDNPADRMENMGEEAGEKHPNPFVRKLMEKVGIGND